MNRLFVFMYKTVILRVVQSLASTIHCIRDYPVDKSIDFGSAYPRNGDLFIG